MDCSVLFSYVQYPPLPHHAANSSLHTAVSPSRHPFRPIVHPSVPLASPFFRRTHVTAASPSHIFAFTSSNSAFSLSMSVACIGQLMLRPSLSFGLGILRRVR